MITKEGENIRVPCDSVRQPKRVKPKTQMPLDKHYSISYYEGYSSIRKNDEFVKIQVEALKSTYEGVETISWKIKKLLKNEIKIPLNSTINFYDI